MTPLCTKNNYARHKQHFNINSEVLDRVSALGLSLGVPRKLKSNERAL